MGSGELIQTLMRHDLIDEYLLLIHPLVLRAGRRLFGDGGPPASLRLVDSTVSTTGVLIATYQPEQLDKPPGANHRSRARRSPPALREDEEC
jgi:dihydrofolate reductase